VMDWEEKEGINDGYRVHYAKNQWTDI
jgi:hypothetical protein